MNDTNVTFFTICNEPYFPGVVALLNSLRLTGNDGSLVVLDLGLSDTQRSRLEPHVTIVEIPAKPGTYPTLFKAFPRFFDPNGVVVIIDSDMIVTRSLSDIVASAIRGKICVFPDHFTQVNRWFKEWETALELRATLRRQIYVNSGFIVLSTVHWPDFLTRFWELCERIPPDTVFGRDPDTPFWPLSDQDALNALLMSEIPADAVEVLSAGQEAYPDGLLETEIINAKTLECVRHGEQPAILHYALAPKAWDRTSWLRVRRDAYVRLFGRVACGSDVPLRMHPGELPLWLRPTVGGRAALRTLDVTHGAVAALQRRLPARASAAMLRMKERLARGRGT